MASIIELRQHAQDGKDILKAAIVQFLAIDRNNWFKRSDIEQALGLESSYASEGEIPSYEGGLASILLSELVVDGQIDRTKQGTPWVYRVKPRATQI